MNYQLTVEGASKQLLEQTKFPFTVMMKHGSMSIEYFAPKGIDTQTPHKQDEIYIIVEGHSMFYRDGEAVSCKKNDILFVPAGMKHWFEDFSEDFATWVIFYGPDGGERTDDRS